MERHDVDRRRPGERRERLARASDLGGAGQEHEHVARRRLAEDAAHRRARPGRRAGPGARPPRREVVDRDLEAPPLGAERAGAEEPRDRRGVERRRHRDEPEVGARGVLEAPQEREREVALEVALVELVEHDRADAGQGGCAEQAPREEPLRDVADPGARSGDLLEPHLPADRLAGLLAHLLRDAPGGEARREPPRLEHHDLAAAREPGLVQRARDAGRLPRARRRLDHDRRRLAERGDDLREERVDWQLEHARGSTRARRRGRPWLAGPQGSAVPGERAPRRRARPRAGI